MEAGNGCDGITLTTPPTFIDHNLSAKTDSVAVHQ